MVVVTVTQQEAAVPRRMPLGAARVSCIPRRFLSNTSSKPTLFGFPLSQPTRSVLLLLKENKIEYDFVLVDALKGENRKQDFLKINPAGLVPCIRHNDFLLPESSAILQYLAEFYGLEKWYPKDIKERAKIQFWLSWNHQNTRMCTKKLLVTKLFPPKNTSTDEFPKYTKEVARSMTFLNSELEKNKASGQGPFLTGSKDPTIADLQLLTEMDQLLPEAFGYFDFTPFNGIQRYISTLQNSLVSYSSVYNPVVSIAAQKKKL